jgi:hypothetical protein
MNFLIFPISQRSLSQNRLLTQSPLLHNKCIQNLFQFQGNKLGQHKIFLDFVLLPLHSARVVPKLTEKETKFMVNTYCREL